MKGAHSTNRNSQINVEAYATSLATKVQSCNLLDLPTGCQSRDSSLFETQMFSVMSVRDFAFVQLVMV